MKILEFVIPYHDTDCKIIGSGVLIYAIHDNKIHFLLGQEDSDKRFGIFGGRIKPNNSIEETAIREFEEETLGVVTTKQYIEHAIRSGGYSLKFNGAAGINRYFVTYMIRIPFNATIPAKFRRTRTGLFDGSSHHTVPGCVDSNGKVRYDYLEKRELSWFPADDIIGTALRSRWNHPVEGIPGHPMFRRPFLAGLSGLVQYFNLNMFLRDLVWCENTCAINFQFAQ